MAASIDSILHYASSSFVVGPRYPVAHMAQSDKEISNDLESWTTFFTNAAIPATQSLAYAQTFVDNRITKEALADLTSEHLRLLGITVLGDILNITRHIKSLSASPPVLPFLGNPGVNEQYKATSASIKLPHITADLTPQQFRKVRTDWNVYKV